MKYQSKSYQASFVRVIYMATLRVGVKSWRNQYFDIYWEQRVDLR